VDPNLSKPRLKFSSTTKEIAGRNGECVIWLGMGNTSIQAVCLAENCIPRVTVAPVQLHEENGSTSGSPGHELPCHEFSKVREAREKDAFP